MGIAQNPSLGLLTSVLHWFGLTFIAGYDVLFTAVSILYIQAQSQIMSHCQISLRVHCNKKVSNISGN